MPGIVQVSFMCVPHVSSQQLFEGYYYCSLFANGRTEAQKGEVACCGLNPGLLMPGFRANTEVSAVLIAFTWREDGDLCWLIKA